MGIVVLLEFRVKADAVEDTKKYFKRILPDTRAFAGYEGLDVFTDADNPTSFVFYERWQSKQHYEKYVAWRSTSGNPEEFGSKLAGAPTVRILTREDL